MCTLYFGIKLSFNLKKYKILSYIIYIFIYKYKIYLLL